MKAAEWKDKKKNVAGTTSAYISLKFGKFPMASSDEPSVVIYILKIYSGNIHTTTVFNSILLNELSSSKDCNYLTAYVFKNVLF